MRAAGEGRAILDSYSYELRDEGGPNDNNVRSKGRHVWTDKIQNGEGSELQKATQ
jgi:hypothetical protein